MMPLLLGLVFFGVLSAVLFFLNFRLRNELKNRLNDLQQLKRHGFDFVANVSHELKTPLTSIQGFTETLKISIDKDPQKSKEFLDRIAENSARLSYLINDILELASVDQPNFYLEKKTIRVDSILQEVEKKFSFAVASKKQVLVIRNEIEEMRGDPWLIEQALSNLIENAHRYCPEGALIEVVGSLLTQQSEKFFQIEVIDNGPGIAPNDLPRIFERFYRVDKSRNRDLGGTGLGLAIVKHIMISHGGVAEVSSELQKGTHFTLKFPT